MIVHQIANRVSVPTPLIEIVDEPQAPPKKRFRRDEPVAFGPEAQKRYEDYSNYVMSPQYEQGDNAKPAEKPTTDN